MKLGLISLLHQISSPTLATLSLKVLLTAPLLELQWEEIDRILTGHSFGNLLRVTVGVLVPHSPPLGELCLSFGELAEAMKSRMVGLRQRCLLHFEPGVVSFKRWDKVLYN
jgi:hypothetical protein